MTESKFAAEKLKSHVQTQFDNLRKALNVREKLLCRQIDVFSGGKKPVADIKFLLENNEQENLLNLIRTFGKFNIDYLNIMQNEVYQNENEIDHEHNHKTCAKDENPEKQEVVVSLKAHKLRHNLELFNDSLISHTLNETKELINTNSVAPNNPIIDQTIDNDGDKATKQCKHAKNRDVVLGTADVTKPKRKVGNSKKEKSLKNISNLTLNGVTGTLNLRNISNLTINPCESKTPSGHTSPKLTNCDFYKRLITENKLLKNHIRNEITKSYNYTSLPSSASTSGAVTPLSSPTEPHDDCVKRVYITKEISVPLQPITIEFKHAANKHPVQVQQWLKQIIYETDNEPLPTQELLEFSQIN